MSAYIEDPTERRAAIRAAIDASRRYFVSLGRPWDLDMLVERLTTERTTPYAQKHARALVSFRRLGVASRFSLARSIMVDIHNAEYDGRPAARPVAATEVG